jgi:hypothetical protein
MATQIAQVEKDGFDGKVYEGEKGKFVAWHLADLSTARGNSVSVTGVTGENGRPKAAAWNLQHSNTAFLARVLKNRVQLSRGEGGSVDVAVPGARVQGVGYDEPLDLTLKANVAKASDLPVALSLFAGQIADVAARGVYARYAKAEAAEAAEEGEELPEDVASINF